jgi:uncharacterized protein (TIGR03663 family)
MTPRRFLTLVAALFVAALAVRAVRPDLRPMHHDEANQAVKFGTLLERGEYRYDKNEHHGPTLYYATLPFARIAGERDLAALDERTLRLVPAVFGAATILLLALLAGALAREAILFAGLFAAASPVMVYFGRFYIQETLLVFFLALTLAAGWRWAGTRSPAWAAVCGLGAGLMYATKETSLILFAAMAGGLLLAAVVRRERAERKPFGIRIGALAAFLAAAGGSAGLLYTSFLKNPGGLRDSVLAFGGYLGRAGGAGEAAVHRQPWHYYFKLLAFNREPGGPLWSEAFVLALAVAGAIAAFGAVKGRDGHPGFQRFLVFFTGFSAAAYSLLPYKTPWNVLPFYLGVVLLAGNGAALIWRSGRFILFRAVALIILVPGFANLAGQCARANFVYPSDPRNPYVYAQTVPDYERLVRRIEDVAAAAPEGRGTLIRVVAPADETWPLPWSLRRFTQVGFWTDAAAAGDVRGTPLVVASAEAAEALASQLGGDYQLEHFGLRPEVPLTLAVRRDLWDEFMRRRAKSDPR